MIKQLLINGIIAGSVYALIALSFGLIYRTVKFFHFAHGVVYAAGAYLAFTLITFLGFNPVISFFLPLPWRASLACSLIG